MNDRTSILFVDDEKKFADAMAKVLRYGGFAVQVAYSGSRALDFYQSEKYDLVITDLKMPVMDGIQLIRHIRSIDQQQKILVITAFPGQWMPWNRRLSESGGPELNLDTIGYVTKPFTPKRLIEAVEQVFEDQVSVLKDESLNDIAGKKGTALQEQVSEKPQAERKFKKEAAKSLEERFVSTAVHEVIEETASAIGAPAVCALVKLNGVTVVEVNNAGISPEAYSGRFTAALDFLLKTLMEVGSGHLSECILKLDEHWVLVRFIDQVNSYLCIMTGLDVPMGTIRTVGRKAAEGLNALLKS